jgi:hypothetical protein
MTITTKTIFCDIDGTLIDYQYVDKVDQIDPNKIAVFTPGTKEKLAEWTKKNYNLILTTARKESTRLVTENQLRSLGIGYDQLIMGIGIGPRVLINDSCPESNEPMAVSFTVERNSGLGDINV